MLDPIELMMILPGCILRGNYIAGSSFPPIFPESFDEQQFHNLKVVIFALGKTEGITDGIAEILLHNSAFQGLVYAYRPENRDFLNCAKFFGISTYPAYVIISYQEFRKLLCYASNEFNEQGQLKYTVIAGEQTIATIIENAYRFIAECCKMETYNLATLHDNKPLDHCTEVTVLFPNPRNDCSKFENVLYEAFIRFGAITDDVLIRVLYPTFISDEYQKIIKKYGIVSLPCAIFFHKATERVVVMMERDSFEAIPNFSIDTVKFLISDIHRAIAVDKLEIAKSKVEAIALNKQKISTKYKQNRKGEKILIIRPHAVVVGNVQGNVTGGDSVQGNKS